MTNLVVKESQQNNSFDRLKQFQIQRQELENTGEKLLKIIKDCVRKGLLANSLTKEAEKALKKLRDTRFRVAVIGEFSQGKSTLLNALLGEEIQPVRMIPCSGTVTVLKYGSKKKVICHYKNGRSEEIPLEQYQEKAAIPEEIAEVNLTQGLINSKIKEIVFEHPELELCRNGIEIVDSPGLNEHPERSAITRQIIKDTDAIIFLTNASRLLTEGERELIQELRSELNNGSTNKPAENIFVLVNFMDLVRREKDRQSIEKRAHNFLIQGGIITGKNRIHFISAQAALDAILDKKEDDYFTKFRDFTQSLEQFLLDERGSLKIKQTCDRFENLIRSTLEGLDKLKDNEIQLYKTEKEQILERIGAVSGIDLKKIRNSAKELCHESNKKALDSFNKWKSLLKKNLIKRSKQWTSKYNLQEEPELLIKNYENYFVLDLKAEIDEWQKTKLAEEIMIPAFKLLNQPILKEMELIKQDLQSLKLNFKLKKYIVITKNNDDNNIDSLSILDLVLLYFIFISKNSPNAIEIKDTLITIKLTNKKIYKSLNKIDKQLEKNICSGFDRQVENIEKAIQEIIKFYDRALEEIEIKEREEQKQLADRTKEIKQIQKEIETIYRRSIG